MNTRGQFIPVAEARRAKPEASASAADRLAKAAPMAALVRGAAVVVNFDVRLEPAVVVAVMNTTLAGVVVVVRLASGREAKVVPERVRLPN